MHRIGLGLFEEIALWRRRTMICVAVAGMAFPLGFVLGWLLHG